MQIGIAKPCEQHVRWKINGEALASRNGLPKNLEAVSRDSLGRTALVVLESELVTVMLTGICFGVGFLVSAHNSSDVAKQNELVTIN